MKERHLTSSSPARTMEIARTLLKRMSRPAVIALYGDLGSGKTCFVQGLGLALGVRQPITSPTFTVINEYAGEAPLVHVDLYRLEDPDDILAIGFEDYLDRDGVMVIEWAERAGDLIPAGAVRVYFEVGPRPRQRFVRICSQE